MKTYARLIAGILVAATLICIIFIGFSSNGRKDKEPIELTKIVYEVNKVAESDIKLTGDKRISDDFIGSFTPGTNEGFIYPFIGNGNYTYDERIHSRKEVITHHELYGFCDSNGTVVCDPIYENIYVNKNSYTTYRLDEEDIVILVLLQ